ncbi:MAG: preprotein translocase subunit SecY, partial [Clostridia bacterium]|nr:preprotein translocase subunit SecY [Clostridia bacterium]
MLKTFANAWKLPDLRKKLLFTLAIVVLYRIGCVLPVPFIDPKAISDWFNAETSGTMLQYLNILSGSAFSQATLFALSVSPYITSSIVIQLLTIAIPALERLSKQGEEGKKKLTQITRYATVAIALITSYGYYVTLSNIENALIDDTWFTAVVIISCHCAGAALIM